MEVDTGLAYRIKELCNTAARDKSRPVLETVHIESGPERTILVTADGFRMAAMALPITNEKPFELHVDAQSMSKLVKRGNLDITPAGVNINGILLPDTGVPSYPSWRSVVPDLNPQPRANIAIFQAGYATGFLKYRFGKDYNKLSTHTDFLHWSIYNGDTCGVLQAHTWAWEEYGVYYLYILMPMNMVTEHEPYDPDKDPDPDTWKDGFVQMEKLLSERLVDSVKEVTTEIPWEVWK